MAKMLKPYAVVTMAGRKEKRKPGTVTAYIWVSRLEAKRLASRRIAPSLRARIVRRVQQWARTYAPILEAADLRWQAQGGTDYDNVRKGIRNDRKTRR